MFCWVISRPGLVDLYKVDDVIGMFGEDMCNASGNRLLSFLNEVELMICNGRKLVSEPEWTRIIIIIYYFELYNNATWKIVMKWR